MTFSLLDLAQNMDKKLPDVLLKNLLTSYSAIDFAENEAQLTSFVTDSCRSLLEKNYESAVKKFNAQESRFFNNLVCIFVESAKQNLDTNDLLIQLNSEKFPPVLTKSIFSMYDSNKIDLRAKLNEIGWHFPRIIDCDWKLDYQIKASSQEEINRPNFKISFVTTDCDKKDETSNFMFDCSAEQMQELVWKLKEASKLVEKMAHAK